MEEGTKACPVCGETIKAVAIKCRFCNTDLTAQAAQAEAEVEKELFTGHPAIIYTAWQWLWAPLIVAVVAGAIAAGLDAPLAVAGGLVLLIIVFLHYWWKSVRVTLWITTQRIKHERGALNKVQESLELFRIDHFELVKPLGMRLVGQSTVNLFTSDKADPEIVLYGIPDLEQLADTLRECQLRERKRRGMTAFVKT
jgi:hypothetical protein